MPTSQAPAPTATQPVGTPPAIDDTSNIFGFGFIKDKYQALSGYHDEFPRAIFGDLADKIINALIGISASLAVLMIVWAGIQYLTAYGNEDKTASAKKTIIWSLAGLAIVALVYTILNITAWIIQNIK